jgi:hypothetical protein
LQQGLLPSQGLGDAFRAQFALIDESIARNFNTQRFTIGEDPQLVPLARYSDDRTIASAVKRMPKWTSIYVAGLAGISAELIHNAAVEAGCYAAIPPNIASLAMNDRFISLHALRTVDCPITFLQPKNVIDPDTGKTIANNVTSFKVALKAQNTYWYLLGKPRETHLKQL